MLKPEGYSIITAPGARDVEHETSTCAHCQAISLMRAGFGPAQVKVMRADGSHYFVEAPFCRGCFRHICPRKECGEQCVPFEKRLEIEERAARRMICS